MPVTNILTGDPENLDPASGGRRRVLTMHEEAWKVDGQRLFFFGILDFRLVPVRTPTQPHCQMRKGRTGLWKADSTIWMVCFRVLVSQV